ncbi:LOW QUALITY PROTEIN: something about silencing protein 10 [Canis lupus dingo]|uniref:UTP3 small subunit processome component n=1 Tax=Canis lupus familiaris TaxID=9615 RepID=A0A8I3N5W3_CANLF|nr:LOW QUALITY PROTEIN: something about silencing protein 10 [Canis lupus dingo]XP_038541769.1 something about silencing protein 10 [Canis lupus familiaris]
MAGGSRRRGAAKWAAVRGKAGPGPADGNEDGLELPPSPGDSSYYQDQVDDFHEARSRAALAKGWSGVESEEEDGDEEEEEEEEVLALDVADEDDEDGDSAGEEEDDEDDGGSSVQSEAEASGDPSLSWGQRKKLYYDTDYGSKARSRQSQQEVEEEEREEEEEAQLIQRRLAQALQEEDFGVTWVEAFAKPVSQVDEAETRVVKDLAKVSVKEKLKMLRKESPELLELIEDLKLKLTEVKDELEPLLQLVEQGIIPPGKGSQYLRTKYNLYLNYCANISFYLILKARRVPAHGHPVIERLVTYRNLINKLSVVDQKLSSEIRHLLTLKGDAGNKEPISKAKFTKAKPKSVSETPAAASAVTDVSDDSDFDEEAARKYYKEIEDQQKLKRKKEEDSIEEQALEDQNAKRAITYQIAKNRGLTPRRKKIDRNPRVKHREKFRRAKIRRRGQVREVRREEQRYSGELSGIRAGVKKSIKLK